LNKRQGAIHHLEGYTVANNPNHNHTERYDILCSASGLDESFMQGEKHKMKMFEGKVIRTAFGLNVKQHKIT
jgi:hypothetical protein